MLSFLIFLVGFLLRSIHSSFLDILHFHFLPSPRRQHDLPSRAFLLDHIIFHLPFAFSIPTRNFRLHHVPNKGQKRSNRRSDNSRSNSIVDKSPEPRLRSASLSFFITLLFSVFFTSLFLLFSFYFFLSLFNRRSFFVFSDSFLFSFSFI